MFCPNSRVYPAFFGYREVCSKFIGSYIAICLCIMYSFPVRQSEIAGAASPLPEHKASSFFSLSLPQKIQKKTLQRPSVLVDDSQNDCYARNANADGHKGVPRCSAASSNEVA